MIFRLLLIGFFMMVSVADHRVLFGDDIFQANRRLGRGINLGNFLEPPRDVDWGVKLDTGHLRIIREAGFDSIRIPVRWSDYAGEKQPYTIEQTIFDKVDRFLKAAEELGLKVVLNNHHYEGLDKEPSQHLERFQALWRQIATRYQTRGSWLYFELHNEPHENLNDRWNQVLRLGLAAVRETNPTRPVIIGPTFWNNVSTLNALDLPSDPNLIVTIHIYSPFEFTHQGAEWTDPKVRTIVDRTFGSPEEIEALHQELERAAAWSREKERPIYLGEFGAYGKAPQKSRVLWTSTVARKAEQLGFSWSYWEFASVFGAFDLARQSWRPELMEALLPRNRTSYAEEIKGATNRNE